MTLPTGLTTPIDPGYDGLIYPTLVMEVIEPDENHRGEVRFHFKWVKEAQHSPVYDYTEAQCSGALHYVDFYLRFWLNPQNYIPTHGIKACSPAFVYMGNAHAAIGSYELRRMTRTIDRWNIIMENRLERGFPPNTVGEYVSVMSQVENLGYVYVPDVEAEIRHPAAERPIMGWQPLPLTQAIKHIDRIVKEAQLQGIAARRVALGEPDWTAESTITIAGNTFTNLTSRD